MSVREIGPYVLLHKLSEDALSETYRAGLKSGDDVERVVLACFFKAGQEDVDWIAETASVGRRALMGLTSPQLADIVDSGEVGGTAFLAYDYISGVSLSKLMETSRREGIQVPLELAILIVDGSAKGLVAAWQHESRMLHGFLVPPLVMVSNEGEVRLLGLEVASRLRRLLKDEQLREELGPYLAPEVVPEGQPTTTDDIYSLGAMLFELATGTPPPIGLADLEEAVATATLADGSELPEEIRDLLAAGLAPTLRRSNLQGWSEKLSEIVLSGRYEATSFNLAFFLHRLFGDELEDQAGLPTASSEASTDLLASAAAELEDETVVPDTRSEGRRGESSDEVDYESDGAFAGAVPAVESPDKSAANRKRLAIAASIVAFAVAAAGTTYFFGAAAESSNDQTAPLVAPVSSTPLSQPPLTQPRAQPQAAAVTPDLEAEIDRREQNLSSQWSQAIGTSLRGQHQETIDDLTLPLDEAQPKPGEAFETVDVEPAQVVAVVEQPPTETGLGSLGGGGLGAEALDEPSAPQTGLMATEEPRKAPQTQPTSPVTLQAEVEPAEQPTPSSPPVQLGDLVSSGPGVKPPKLFDSVQPVQPLMKRRLKQRMLVSLRVLVDETGSVIQIEQLGEAAGQGFDEAAIERARKMIWEPATKDGVRVKMWRTISLSFQP